MTDISMEDVKKQSNLNIYEAVVIMSKRARQINDEQKAEIMIENQAAGLTDTRDNEDFDEVEIDREALEREYKKYPKPSTLALVELMEDKIKYRRRDTDDENGTAEPDESGSQDKKHK